MENRIKVLIADGSEAFCGHLKNELQQLDGYDLVGTAADGEEAVRLLEATKPDILVLDLMLAKRDGISVLRYANAMDKPPVGLVTSGFITDYVAMTVSNLGMAKAHGASTKKSGAKIAFAPDFKLVETTGLEPVTSCV